MGWKYKKIDIFEAVEIVKASPNEFVTQDVKIRNCVRAEDASEAINQVLRALWLARAMNGYNTTYNETSYHNYMIEHPDTKISRRRWFGCWNLVERKCLQKAKEFE